MINLKLIYVRLLKFIDLNSTLDQVKDTINREDFYQILGKVKIIRVKRFQFQGFLFLFIKYLFHFIMI